MKRYNISVNGKAYDVVVEEVAAGSAPVAAAPAPVAAAPAPVAAVPTGSGTSVTSPMPGTILDIKTSVGASVKKGDVLFILEAMKMENDIVAPCDGTVASVLVTKGASVNSSDPLAEIK